MLSSERALTVSAAAKLLGCSPRRVSELIQTGFLKTTPRFGKSWFVLKRSAQTLLKEPRDLRSPKGKRVHTPETVRLKFERYLAEEYGIDTEDWARMYEAQAGLCPGCKRKLTFDRKTHVDHCHVTKRVRGLLCNDCNLLLGNADDNVETLLNLVEYLRPGTPMVRQTGGTVLTAHEHHPAETTEINPTEMLGN